VLSEILVRLLNDQLNPASYPAQLAGLSYSLYRHSRGISFRIKGYQDKQLELLRVILDAIRNPSFTTEQLELVKAELSRALNNQLRERPSSQTVHEIYRLLMDPYWTEAERLAEIPSITLEQVLDHLQSITGKVALTTLAHGDLTREQANEMNALLLAAFPDTTAEDTVARPRIRKLGLQQPHLRTMDVDHGDTAISYLFQGDEKTVQGRARSRLLGQLIESPFYFDLRTTNRVGYLVFATAMNLLEVPAILLSVQSPSHDAQSLDDLVTDFLRRFPQELSEMPEAEFKQSRAGLVAQILARDTNLSDRSNRYWTEIDLQEYDFDSRQQMAEAIQSLEQADMTEYLEMILDSEPRLLIVQSPGRRPEAADNALHSEARSDTGNPEEFRERPHDYFPALR
jgi:secreted Zn-dependent insulinase-like peptidase